MHNFFYFIFFSFVLKKSDHVSGHRGAAKVKVKMEGKVMGKASKVQDENSAAPSHRIQKKKR